MPTGGRMMREPPDDPYAILGFDNNVGTAPKQDEQGGDHEH
jgi:hypothetical protein